MSTDSSISSKGEEPSEKIHGQITSVSGNDLSALQITSHRLNGRNYLQWAQSVKIVICGRGKLGYLTGELQSPSQIDPTYKTWLAENSMVLAGLINSMEPNISRRYLWFKTAKEVWDAAKRMYSDLGNASQIFELRSKLKEMKQGSNSVTLYFSDIQDLWQELDLFLETSTICAECTAKVQANVDAVRGRVVARDPFPSPEDAFAEVRREEMRRKVMLPDNHNSSPAVSEVSALLSNKYSTRINVMGNVPGVITVIVLVTPRISAGKYMANHRIGSLNRGMTVVHFKFNPPKSSCPLLEMQHHSLRNKLSRLRNIVVISAKLPLILPLALLLGRAL
ncbi:uncharacterized protein [Henckelia pumila]|uniref:uncharacterized protein n=1 Tax=Henckelia pumila TaxID=405737 RepID=UPI003C6E09FE